MRSEKARRLTMNPCPRQVRLDQVHLPIGNASALASALANRLPVHMPIGN